MRVLLTNGHRNTGICITRHLGAAGHQVIASDSRALAFGLRSRFACAFEMLPDLSAPEYGDALLTVVRRTRPDVLLPLGGLPAVSARREALERETRVLVADEPAFEVLLDKAAVYGLCERFGIPHPTVLGTDLETAVRALRDTGDGWPLAVIKPRRDHGAGRGLVFIRGAPQLRKVWPELAARYGPMVATEFVPGPVDSQNALHLLFDRDGALIEFFVLQKLRQWPPNSGITAAAVSTHELELIEQMLPLFRHLRWRGPAEVELKRDTRTGAACVLEINPRFSGTLPFSLAAGVDLPAAMLKASLGQPAARALRPYYAAGLYYWNPWPYLRSVLSDLVRPSSFQLGLRGLVLPFARHPVGNPYQVDDPAALVGKLLFQVAEAFAHRRAEPERYDP